MELSERTYRLAFTGTASEYFRIWIINVFLTVVTLGIYNAWAKVRTRRYFYAHTSLDGYAFDYLANPIAILKGNLILAAGFILFLLAQQFALRFSGLAVLGLYSAMPYLIYKSLRFRTHNSAYRNIRLRFHGSLGESYRIHLLLYLLVPLTLGLIIPYIAYRKKKYVFDHFAYGSTRSRFNGTASLFYQTYFAVLGVSVLAALLSVVASSTLSGMIPSRSIESDGVDPTMLSALVIAGYLVFIFAASLIQQYMYAQFSNYCWNNSTLSHVRFHSSLRTWPLVGLRLTNLLAIICSLGLLIPWAKIRRTRYLLDHMHLIVRGDLDHFTADPGTDEHALGDVSADFFDVEVGL